MIQTLTPDDLAALLKLPRRTVLESVTKAPGFPASVTGARKPRWLEEDVRKFLKRQSVKLTQSSHNTPQAA